MNKHDNIRIVNDCVSDYVIVHGANANPSEINAANELQSYIMKISGVLLPVISDNTNSTRKEIVVGKTNREAHGDYDRNELGDDGFIIKTTEDKLWQKVLLKRYLRTRQQEAREAAKTVREQPLAENMEQR